MNKAGRNEMGFSGSAAFDEGWWPEGSARAGAFLVACLMGVAMILLASAPAFAATASSVTVTSNNNPAKAGQAVTFTATVTPSTATGTIQFKIDGAGPGAAVPLSGGTAGLAMSSAPSVGTHTVTAEYSGDATVAASTGILAGGQQVTKGDTRTEVTSSKNPSLPGEDITITAKVFPMPLASGTVRFKVDGEEIDEPVTLSNGVAQVELTSDDDSTGTSEITAEYSGDVNFNPSTGSLPGGQVVSGKKSTTTKLTALVNSNRPDQRSYIATITPSNASGTVQFKVDGINLGFPAPVNNGVARTGVITRSAASSTVTAEYSGDANFSPSIDTFNEPGTGLGPKIGTSVKLTYGINTVQMSKAVTFHAAITPAEATGTVQFKLDGKNIGSPVPVKAGVAGSTAVALTPGDHKVEAEYSGDAHFQPSRGVMDKVNVGSGKPRVLPRTGSSTVPLALLAAAFMVSGILIQRRANRIDAEKMPPEDYRF